MHALLRLIRPQQWVKNLFVFMPAFFAGQILEESILVNSVLAFFAFSLTASAVYIFNDFMDREQDAVDPAKQNRPLVSGEVTLPAAFGLTGLLLVLTFVIGWFSNMNLVVVLVAYVGINVLYSLGLKHIPILELVLVASGFILREYAGSVMTGVPISQWLIMMTFLLAMILALGKRRSEYLRFIDGKVTRKVMNGYNLAFIDAAMVIMAAVTLVTYIMYTISTEVTDRFGSMYIYVTSLFVLLGLLRYLQLSLVLDKSESPTKVFYSDLFIQLVLVTWILSFFVIIYF